MKDMNEAIKEAEDLSKNRESWMAVQPKCYSCRSDQMQLMFNTDVTARWRCRRCKSILVAGKVYKKDGRK